MASGAGSAAIIQDIERLKASVLDGGEIIANRLADDLISELLYWVPGAYSHPLGTGILQEALTQRKQAVLKDRAWTVGVGNKDRVGKRGEKAYQDRPVARYLEWWRSQYGTAKDDRIAARKKADSEKRKQIAARIRANKVKREEQRRQVLLNKYNRLEKRIPDLEERLLYWEARYDSASDKVKDLQRMLREYKANKRVTRSRTRRIETLSRRMVYYSERKTALKALIGSKKSGLLKQYYDYADELVALGLLKAP